MTRVKKVSINRACSASLLSHPAGLAAAYQPISVKAIGFTVWEMISA